MAENLTDFFTHLDLKLFIFVQMKESFYSIGVLKTLITQSFYS
jgi:hypothetical protein